MSEAKIWKVRPADLRRMAGRAQEAERQRKLLALADQFETSAPAGETPGAEPDPHATRD